MRVTMCALTLVALFAGFAGCSKGDPTNPVGTWNLDTSALLDGMKKSPEYKKAMEAGGEDAKMAKAMEEGISKTKVTVDIKDDKTFTGTVDSEGKKSSSKGTWKLEGDKLTMTTTEEDGKAKTPPEVEILTFKDNVLTMEKGPMKMTLRR